VHHILLSVPDAAQMHACSGQLKQLECYTRLAVITACCVRCFLTGMATPHVTGAVALYIAAHKRRTGAYPSFATTKATVMNSGTAASTYTVRARLKAKPCCTLAPLTHTAAV